MSLFMEGIMNVKSFMFSGSGKKTHKLPSEYSGLMKHYCMISNVLIF